MIHYDVDVTREDGYWVAVVRGARGGATETRRLDALDGEVRDLLAGLGDVDEESLDLTWHLEHALGEAAAKRLGEYERARDGLRRAEGEYESAQHEAVTELRSAGISLRDSAELLDISFQRVQQIAS